MAGTINARITDVVQRTGNNILQDWTREQLAATRPNLIRESEFREQAAEFLRLFQTAARDSNLESLQSPAWNEIRQFLGQISRTRNLQGFSPSETATFVFSFKNPLFVQFRQEFGREPDAMADAVLSCTRVLDQLGLWTVEAFQKEREEVILRQQEEMLEISTPVVKLWDGILALPMIGTLDSARSQVVMESLLGRIVETGSTIAIIDITGVPTVDTVTAQHLLKTVTAARLMGADCIISGIRPQIAQTIVHLGVDLNAVVTKASLADAFAFALRRRSLGIVRLSETGKSN